MSKLATPAVVGVSAVLGAGLALGAGALGVGGDDTTTTILRQAPIAQTANADTGEEGGAPTAREIYERDAPGVVLVEATVQQRTSAQSLFGQMPQTQENESTGSGFVIDDEGYILTNEHVVEGATKVEVSFSNEKTAAAQVVGKDNSNDIALLKVDPKGLDLKPLELGSAKEVQVGDPVLAIGNPFGLDRTLTTGVVSAKQRQITGPGGFSIDNVIQTDASINPGNSGGPLLDGAGRVIGINSQIATSGSNSGSVGIGFAVPIDTVKRVLPDLKKDGHANIAYLGVTNISVADFPDGLPEQIRPAAEEGAIVQQVAPGSPAEKAGLRAGTATINTSQGSLVIGGDVITKVDGRKVAKAEDVTNAITGKRPGDKVKIVVLRGSREKTLEVTLGRRPDSVSGDASTRQGAPDEGFRLP